MKIGAIVQARMSSARFASKVLYDVGGKPMLQYLLERLEHCRRLDAVVVATSKESSDTPIAEFCKQYGVDCYRGPLGDVAGRFEEVLHEYPFDAFVRVTGDSPLLDQSLVDRGVKIFRDGDYDLVSNVAPATYPAGQSVEVLRADTFRQAYQRMREAEDLEHVTMYFYKHPEDFRIKNFALSDNLNNIRLCVDTKQDMEIFTTIISRMERPHWEYHLEDILRIYRSLA